MPEDFYDLLSVHRDASQRELKEAYREQVREYHPDLNDDERATEQFQVVKRAYDVLSDPVERNAYDRLGHREYVARRMDGLPGVERLGDDGESGRTTREGRSAGGQEASQTARQAESGRATPGPGASPHGSTGEGRESAEDRRGATRSASEGRARQSGERESYGRVARARARSPGVPETVAVLAAAVVYVGGLATFVLANRGALAPVAEALTTGDPRATWRALLAAGDALAGPYAVASGGFEERSAVLLFPVGAVLLPAVLAWLAGRVGGRTPQVAALAALGPCVAVLVDYAVVAGVGVAPSAAATVGLLGTLLVALPAVGAVAAGVALARVRP